MNEIQLLWINLKARFEIIYIPNLKNFIYFQELSFKNLIGKIGVMDGRIVKSNGGYRYYQMEISKLPVSKKHNYN